MFAFRSIVSLCFVLLTAACAGSGSQRLSEGGQTVWLKKYNNEDEKERARLRLTALSLEQAEKMTLDWPENQRDCAGFVRYVYRRGVTGRAQMWLGREGQLESYVSAEDLVRANFMKVRERVDDVMSAAVHEHLQTGDLLVFHQPQAAKGEDWHLMMVVKSPHMHQKNRVLVVYHNGAQGTQGAMRKVWLDDLLQSPQNEWRPQAQNKFFYGVYRWKYWL